ncbi:bifunctional DNA-formamidopyrimidine glycosylase/DNA-(apurinic or apyrimidinic site) lyase [Candidatus Berkelbacteria bacterium]|nr:bifunctional DNA-formamidopyrimidine glycosylase/DNA-(apurinic or apyrimidinic site) lyase [Candidatus Berkelbacteria bacterium]
MPELPEVETVRRGLERTIVGKTIASVEIRVPKMFQGDSTQLINSSVIGVERRAKVLLVRFDNEWTLAIHLKMTGQIIVVGTGSAGFVAGHPEKAYEQPLPHKHTHVTIGFDDGATLYYNDLRKFGWFRLMPTEDVGSFLVAMKHGPEPLSDEFTLEGFRTALKRRRIPIKTALLDQTIVAGVGNIYADEALFAAKIRPTRKASSLTGVQIERLYHAVKTVLELGIKHGGTSMNTYVNVEGTKGAMRDHLKVYGREGLPCEVCGNPIERIKLGQRSSHYCPGCQR